MSAWRSSLSSQRLKLRIGKCLATTLAVTIACAVSGCSCPIGKAPSAPLTPIESIPDHGDTGSVGSVGPAKKALGPAAVDPELLKRAKPPSCELTGGAKPSPGTPGANADPNLLEIARLQLVNECYKLAERTARESLERLQGALFKPESVDPELLKKAKPPSCELTGATKPSPGTPGANADPNLLEIARLQLVDECYKLAERTARKRLERLQNAFADRLRS
jgi:hypothetical protein